MPDVFQANVNFLASSRIIVAVDTNDLSEAIELVDELEDHVGMFKFGLEFGTNLLVSLLTERSLDRADHMLANARRLFDSLDGRIMFDWKFKDIPNTMSGASAGLNALHPMFFTIHASSGVKGMRAAVEQAGKSKVLAVTVLTSMSAEECSASYGGDTLRTVRHFAELARRAGVHGIVCAPSDVQTIRESLRWDAEFVCPGIRPAWAETGDQNKNRAMTPAEAIRAGVTRMVIGRPITKPPPQFASRAEAADAIAEEIASALT